MLGVQIPAGTDPTERERIILDTQQTIERRVNELGVAEAVVARQGSNHDQLLVQLPGVTNIESAKGVLQSTGLLTFQLVERGPSTSREELMVGGVVPAGREIVPDEDSRLAEGEAATLYYLVLNAPSVSGRDIRTARPSLDENNRPTVSFTLNADGGRAFGAITGQNIGRLLAVILDGKIRSVARIENRITTEGRILGNFTPDEVKNLAVLLRTGSLSVPLAYLAEQTVGPSLGADAIRAGVMASVLGLGLIVLFLLIYYRWYRWSGINAVVALAFNLIIVLAGLAYFDVVMTLPGVAGFILTMGVGVDSNVLIFERIKEELEAGHSARASIHAGFDRVFRTLLDTHVAALIAAAFLFQFGTGTIRGFAVTLSIGLVSNLFTSTFVSRMLFDLTARGKRERLSI